MQPKKVELTEIINGHEVSFSFAETENVRIAETVRNILLDSFIRQNMGIISNRDDEKLQDDEDEKAGFTMGMM